MRNNKFKFLSYLLVFVLISILFTACGDTGSKETESTTGAVTTGQSSVATTTGVEEKKIDPLGKYEPGIELTFVRNNDSVQFSGNDSFDNNVWTQTLEKDLGIKLKHLWVAATTDVWAQKLNIAITTNDIPDFIVTTSAIEFKRLTDAGLLADVTEVYNNYKLPLLHEILSAAGDIPFKSAIIDGKMMGLPISGSVSDKCPVLWARKDWLTKLNLPEPKTIDDVLAISKAFTEKDPDGNNKNDTYGLAVNKDLYQKVGGNLSGFFNCFHAYVYEEYGYWLKDSTGKLVCGAVQPQVKAALQKLQELYAAGQIDREFGVKDETKIHEMMNAGTIGMTFGPMYTSLRLNDSLKIDPNADWRPYPLVSIDNEKGMPQSSVAVNNYIVVSKNAKNPEAVIKLFNYWCETRFGESCTPEVFEKLCRNKDGVQIFKYFPYVLGRPDQNLVTHREIMKALETKDISKMNPGIMDSYKKVDSYLNNGDVTNYGIARVFGPGGSQSVLQGYVDRGLIKISEFYGNPTPTIAEKWSTLKDMQLQTFTRIIMGDAPISEFDKFVSDWEKTGGEQITKEVNEWYAAQK